MSKLNKSVGHAVSLYKSYEYHRRHAAQAKAVLETLKRDNGKSLSSQSAGECDEYAVEVLGNRRYAPWLYVYTAMQGEFRPGWIPDNFYGALVVPKLKGAYGSVSGLKPLNRTTFNSDAFPDTLSFVNGLYFTPDWQHIPRERVGQVLFAEQDKAVFKADKSSQGLGVHVIRREAFEPSVMERLGNGLYQRFINQHRALSAFEPNAVATIRLTTVVEDSGSASLRAAYMRLGRSGESVVQSKTCVRVAINMGTGQLATTGHTDKWVEVPAHPDSGTVFAGSSIPNFEACVATVKTLHMRVPQVRCIGWDVAVDAAGSVSVMEWNGLHNDIKYTEAVHGPGFEGLGWEKIRP